MYFSLQLGNCDCKRQYDDNESKSCYRRNKLPKLLPGLISACTYCLRTLEARKDMCAHTVNKSSY